MEQYQQYDKGFAPAEKKFTRTAELPAMGIKWYKAAAYCNWLSKQEGIGKTSGVTRQRDGTGDEAEEELFKSDGLLPPHGSRKGVCDLGGKLNERLLRGDGRVAPTVRLVSEKRTESDVAGRESEAE